MDWTNDKAYAIYQTFKKIKNQIQDVRDENIDNRIYSALWILTDLEIQDDISFDKERSLKTLLNIRVTLESSVFENANPRIAAVDGKKDVYIFQINYIMH